jgi:hypothetical protein
MNSYPALDLEKLKALNEQSKKKEAQKQQAAAQQTKVKQQQQQTAKAQTKQAEEAKFNKTLVSPAPKPTQSGQLDGISKFIEEKIGIPVVDFLDNLSGDQKTPDQIAQERKQKRAEGQAKRKQTEQALEQVAYSNPVSAAATETLRAGIGAFARPVEAAIDKSFQFYLNNTVNKGLSPTDEAYKRAYTELTKAPRTDVAKTGEKLLSFFLLSRALRNVPGAKLGTSPMPEGLKGAAWAGAKAKRIVTEGLVPGAIADFFLTDAKDGNFSEVIKGMVPEELQKSWMFALATDQKKGDPILNSVKSVLEGGPLNVAGNVILPALTTSYRFARGLVAKGYDKDRVVSEALEVLNTEADKNLKEVAQASSKETADMMGVKTEELNQLELDAQQLEARIKGEAQEPPIAEGMTRLYHGSADKGRYDGPAWFSTDKTYARDYRPDAELQYVDVPTARIDELADPDNYGQTPAAGFTFNVELDSSLTGLRKPLQTRNISSADPEEVQQLELDLDNLRQKQTDIRIDLDNAVDPNTQKEYFQNTGTIKADDVNDIGAKQLNLEEGFPGTGRVSIHGNAGNILTEAAVKQMGMSKDVRQTLLKEIEQKIDIKAIAKASGKTYGEVLANIYRINKDFTDSLKTYDNLATDDESALMKKLLSEAGETVSTSKKGLVGVTTETLGAAKITIASYANDLYRLSKEAEKVDTAQIADADYYERISDRLLGLLELYKESTQFFGGSLGALRVRALQNLDQREIDQIIKGTEVDENDTALTIFAMKKMVKEAKDAYRRGDANGLEMMRRLTRALQLSGGDPSKTLSFARTAFANLSEVAARNFYNSILSGVKTIFRNGSVVYGLIERPTSIIIGGALNLNPAQMRAGLAGYHSILGSAGEAWRVARRTIQTGVPANQSLNQFIRRSETKNALETLDQVASTRPEKVAVGFLKWHYAVSDFFDFPEKLMMGMDDYFKTILVRQRIDEKATLEAMESGIYDPKKFMELKMTKYAKVMDPQTGTIKSEAFKEYAEIGTFQSDPGKVANYISGAVSAIPGGTWMIPFIRTPANILTYQLEHLPVVRSFSKNYRAAKDGGDELLLAEMNGRQAIGVMAVTASAYMAANNLITGDMPDPRKESAEHQRWKDLGIKPRSLNFNGVYVPYNMVEPLSNIIAASANIARVVNTYGMSEDFGDRLVTALAITIAGSFTEKSYFQGLANLAELANPETWTSAGAAKAGLNAVNNQLPISGFRRGVANTFDGNMREYSNEFDRMLQNALPIYRNFAPAMISVMDGKPMKNPNGNIWNANVPFEVGVSRQDKVVDMLSEIEFKWGDRLDKFKNIPLNRDQKAIVRKAMFDFNVRGRLLDEMNKPYFKEDLKEWQSRNLGPDREYFKSVRPRVYDNVQEIWSQAEDYAYTVLQEKDPKLGEEIVRLQKKEYQIKTKANYSPNAELANPSKIGLSDSELKQLNEVLDY